MSSKFDLFVILSAVALTLSNGAFAQETGGMPVPDRPLEYQIPPSNGGGGGRPGFRLGSGADVQFGGPRFDFTLPEPQTLYRADAHMVSEDDLIEFPFNAEIGPWPDEETEPEPEEEWRKLPGAPDWPPDGSREWLAYFGIDEDKIMRPEDGERAQVPPNTGGGGRPPVNAGDEDDLPDEVGYNDYDPPDYMEDHAHPWHGLCPGCDDVMSDAEAAQLEEYEARLEAQEARANAFDFPMPDFHQEPRSINDFGMDFGFDPLPFGD